MPRAGKDFEQVVAQVVQALDPAATVTNGDWVAGPDGRREIDVFVRGSVGSKPVRVLIEGKDFARKKTGPVGTGFLDALDSKRRDLGFDFAVLASNAGFTIDALRKAKRLNIRGRGDARWRPTTQERGKRRDLCTSNQG